MDREDIVAITDYLTKGVYPDGLSKVEKRSMRKRCASFLCVDGVLYHRGKAGRRRLVVTDPAERRRIISKMHENSNGKTPHNGINITLRKVVDWYWWRKITEDVRHFCRSCAECSRLFSTSRGVDSVPEFPDELKLRQEEADAQLQFGSCVVSAAELKELSWTFYSSELLSALHQMYKQKVCCDVILSAGGFQVSTHKVILMATSDFLKSLIADHESTEEAIHLTDVCGLCLEPMVSFLYTGSLKLSQDNVLLMMSAANRLGITSAASLCRQFLENGNEAKVPLVKVLSEKPSVIDNNNCSGNNMSSVRFDDIEQSAASPKASESTNCVHDETVILDIKEEISNTSFLVSEDLKDFVPFVIPKKNQLKKKRQQKVRLHKSFSDVSWISNDKKASSHDLQQKRYNTRSVAMESMLQKSVSSKIPMSRSKLTKMKELQKSRRRAMIRLLLETHGKRHLCSFCDSNFQFSSGLVHHLVQRHSVPRLDLAIFRLSRLSIHCAVEFQRIRRIVDKSCQDPRSSSSPPRSNKAASALLKKACPIAERRRCARPCWHNRLYSTWCNLVKNEQQKCRLNKSGRSTASALVFRNRCGWCAMTFLRRADLLEHRQQVHKRRKDFAMSGAVRERRVRHDWTCKEKGCGSHLTTKEALRDHMAAAHPTVFLSCPKCRYKTQVDHYLKRHLVRRHKDRYLCPHCSKPYHKKCLLKVHLYNQHKIEDPTLQLHRCPHDGCDYACPGKSALQTHMQKHTIAKPFTCHICGKDFKRAITLDKHINKVHLGIRPYICDKCGASFCDESELKRHLLKHEKNKTHSCPSCPFSTFHKLVLQSHMFCRHQIVDEKMRLMRCDQCSFVTNKKYRYNDHVKMHKNIRDIPCPECGKSFVTRKTMRQHIVKVHKQTTQCCHLCSFKALTVRKLQEHNALMHDLHNQHSPPTQSSSGTAVVLAGVDTGVNAGVSSYASVVVPTAPSDGAPSTQLSVCVSSSSFADIGLTLHPTVGLSSFPVVQSTALLVDRCVSGFQEILRPPVSCDVASIQLQSLDNGYLPYDPYVADRSMS